MAGAPLKILLTGIADDMGNVVPSLKKPQIDIKDDFLYEMKILR
jgi:hypothetical protein